MVSETPPSGSPRNTVAGHRSTAWLSETLHQARDRLAAVPDARSSAAFWLLGLLNNAVYVIMLAGANEINSGGVGLVYFCAIFPTLLVKATGPYWFQMFTYQTRLWAVALLMALSYTTVAFSSSLTVQLLGVALGSLQSGMGEATCLGLASFYDSRRAITFWSSGTGAAGVFGYSWVAALHTFGGISLTATLLLANSTCLAWLAVLHLLLRPLAVKLDDPAPSRGISLLDSIAEGDGRDDSENPAPDDGLLGTAQPQDSHAERFLGEQNISTKMHSMSWRQRRDHTLTLWPYMVPLFTVYCAEYTLQTGAWSAIGFPVEDAKARDHFYKVAGWLYQAGVFLSRSSGMLYQASRNVLWAMPAGQVVLLVFFSLDAWWHFWYNGTLYIVCFVVGLIGGGVYVNAFTLIGREVEPAYQEFSLTAASLADSLGIMVADLVGIVVQAGLP